MKSDWRCASRLVANALTGEQEAADEGDLQCPTRTLDDGSAGRVARMVTCWRTLAEAREMLLYGAAEMTTPTGGV
jgi:hypothetical protein